MKEGKYDLACAKLEESQRLDPGGGTVFALGVCFESAGRTASAWSAFGEAVRFARRDKRAERESAALEHIRTLEPQLARLKISAGKGLVVKRNETVVGEAQFDSALPVDPGTYEIDASAPGKQSWRQSVVVQQAGATVVVAVPPLVDAKPVESDQSKDGRPSGYVQPPVLSLPIREATSAEPAKEDFDFWTTQRTAGVVVGAGGVVALGLGGIFALGASSKWSDTKLACPQSRCASEADRRLGASAGTQADVATVLATTGALAVVVGAALFLTGAPASFKRAHVRPSLGGLALGGTF
jgi:hypothetical protein